MRICPQAIPTPGAAERQHCTRLSTGRAEPAHGPRRARGSHEPAESLGYQVLFTGKRYSSQADTLHNIGLETKLVGCAFSFVRRRDAFLSHTSNHARQPRQNELWSEQSGSGLLGQALV